ncbi:RNA polymerase-associated protein RapA [Xanthovirga aplysinae]|uniref:RNA polymerase-associated protein RapA n=1 Tax=Xanthovirga aplysinae TaxID=2529853 RepID=UPI0012BCEA4E|nr:RNA polymerase-associated protein RapA [Xanthovirga aplysinae]MTI30246.1 RNA polymerase-associated protein RapA [Xanthovirga aplysinae]
MGIFFLDQRWTSEGEPELGVGIVTEVSKGRVQLHFPISGEVRQYAIENAPLRRVRFKPGDTIIDIKKCPLVIEHVEEKGNLFIYFGQDKELSEADLGEVSDKHGVEDRLSMGDVDTPELFSLRRKTLQHDHSRRISPVNGFVGGRIDLIPHQLYIAHEVSSRYAPRVLLSDQVGLGKTIEACLILHRLLLNGRISRVLILVPDSLVHQWFVEMLRRFNLWLHIFDEERCTAIDDSAPNGNPFLDDQLIICSTSFLAGSEIRARQALSAGWDMLVVDEAHHLEWFVDKVSREYAVVELLSKVAKGLLLLTATPEQLGLESHFARLRLLDPDRYTDFEDFKKESQGYKEIAKIVDRLSLGKTLHPKDMKFLALLFGKERMDLLAEGGASARHNFIEDLLDQHGPGRVIFRNTRSAISGFPNRKAHLIPIKAKDEHGLWIERLTKEFLRDMETSPEASTRPQFCFTNDPRVDWLVQLMEDLRPAKVLLICKSKEKVLALEKALRKRTHLKVGVFHEDLTIVQRDRNAAWFSESGGARLLLCSEIGSEGRNFQFAHHLVLFDLPFHPELLEQRIGRLDRIGQSEEIQIHVPYLIGSPQEVLVKWFHKGLNALTENLEGGNKIAQIFNDRMLNTSLTFSSPKAGNQVESLIADTAVFHQKLKATLTNGRDRLLEMNSFRPKIAEQLVKKIREEDLDRGLESYMTRVFEHFGVEMEDLAPRTYLLHPSKTDTEVFPSIPDKGSAITFDRKRALSREDVSFLSWDHPMVTGAIDMVLSLGTGGASFGVLPGGETPAILIELLFVLETGGKQSQQVDRFLPNTPLRIVVDHNGHDVTDLYPVELIDRQLIPGQVNDLIQNETLMETLLPNMITAATKIAEAFGEIEISNGLQRMNLTLDHEISRLESLSKKNKHIRPEEIRMALEEQRTLASLIRNARIRLDALQLIRKGDF